MHLFLCSFVRLFVQLFVHLIVASVLHVFVCSLIQVTLGLFPMRNNIVSGSSLVGFVLLHQGTALPCSFRQHIKLWYIQICSPHVLLGNTNT